MTCVGGGWKLLFLLFLVVIVVEVQVRDVKDVAAGEADEGFGFCVGRAGVMVSYALNGLEKVLFSQLGNGTGMLYVILCV